MTSGEQFFNVAVFRISECMCLSYCSRHTVHVIHVGFMNFRELYLYHHAFLMSELALICLLLNRILPLIAVSSYSVHAIFIRGDFARVFSVP